MSTHASAPKGSTKSSKASTKTLPVILRLSTSALSRFPSSNPVAVLKEEPHISKAASDASSQPTPTNIKQDDTTPVPVAADESKPTLPTTTDDASTPKPAGPKRKGPAPGSKRAPPALDANGIPIPRVRKAPGPKKRKYMEDTNSPFGGPVPMSNSKLGPKANAGAINDKLRALDRSGKPCRKWERKVFGVRSFTGANWTMPSWHGLKDAVNGSYDVTSDTSSTDAKQVSGRESERSQNEAGVIPQEGMSSPALPHPMQT